MTDVYIVQKLENNKDIIVNVPGSKSITNRALMLAALSDGECNLDGVLFSDDSRAFLDCLEKLGFQLFIDENEKRVKVVGTSGEIPNRKATIDVRSAGTAARFLTVMLAVTGGEYTLNSSEQMKKRPMGEIIDLIRSAGVKISCLEEEGHFPFIISSNGIDKKEVSINTDTSSQYASALLMAAVMTGLKIKLTGKRVNGAYIKITLNMLKQFGIKYVQAEENKYNIEKQSFRLEKYQIEPDMSGACYFYAMSLMLKKKVLVKNLHLNSMQGDIKFLYALKKMGCLVKDTDEGIIIDGSNVSEYKGIEIDMNDFSDQALTMACVAAFAKSKTLIKNVGHIKMQECDRVNAIITNLNCLGIKAREELADGKVNICIEPGKVNSGEIETFNDHRVAMAFTLIGLVCGGITIKNPMCCKKTFENYFDIIDSLY